MCARYEHDSVEWYGVFRGTHTDPREAGFCPECNREVHDGDGLHVATDLATMRRAALAAEESEPLICGHGRRVGQLCPHCGGVVGGAAERAKEKSDAD